MRSPRVTRRVVKTPRGAVHRAAVSEGGRRPAKSPVVSTQTRRGARSDLARSDSARATRACVWRCEGRLGTTTERDPVLEGGEEYGKPL